MNIRDLQNPEIRFLSEPIYEPFQPSGIPPGDELAPFMGDIPGFSISMPDTINLSDHYQTFCLPSIATASAQNASSPTSTMNTELAHTTLNSPRTEHSPFPRQSTSPPTAENTSEVIIRFSEQQERFNQTHSRLQMQQARAGLTGQVLIAMMLLNSRG